MRQALEAVIVVNRALNEYAKKGDKRDRDFIGELLKVIVFKRHLVPRAVEAKEKEIKNIVEVMVQQEIDKAEAKKQKEIEKIMNHEEERQQKSAKRSYEQSNAARKVPRKNPMAIPDMLTMFFK